MGDRVDEKKSLRILIVTHSPLCKELGAGQVAINLADALREQGHNVTLWSPHPLPKLRRWMRFQNIPLMRNKLDEFIETKDPFDIIDCCSFLITQKVSKSTLVVSRSVQPDILYTLSNLLNPRNLKEKVLMPVSFFFGLVDIFFVLRGWAKAHYILCLGSLELEFMRKWFPWWNAKLLHYLNAISSEEQSKLAKIRLNRSKIDPKQIKFLWIGRWTPHKGTKRLVRFMHQRILSNPKDSFTLAGCGYSCVDSFSSELINSGKVKIIPSFERNELYSLLSEHDIGLFTSEVEGWGLVLNEMLESGMPVFATQAGGVVDLQNFCKHLYQFSYLNTPELFHFNVEDLSSKYFEYFTWHGIAKEYTARLFTQLPERINIQSNTI